MASSLYLACYFSSLSLPLILPAFFKSIFQGLLSIFRQEVYCGCLFLSNSGNPGILSRLRRPLIPTTISDAPGLHSFIFLFLHTLPFVPLIINSAARWTGLYNCHFVMYQLTIFLLGGHRWNTSYPYLCSQFAQRT
jgi:hypothetical protein